MVFFISYRQKLDRTKLQLKLRKTFFAECQIKPSFEQIKALVQRISQGNFAEETIEFQKCIGFEAEELSRAGVPVYHLEAVNGRR